MHRFMFQVAAACGMLCAMIVSPAQAIPPTSGETLSGKHVVPADLVQRHTTILIAGFSHDAGMQSGSWRKAVHADSALNGIPVYELAMLEKAPGFIRGVIKNGMRKDIASADQDQIVVLTQDQKLWEKFFGVETDKDPYVIMLNANGDVIWHGHGPAATLEPQLRAALKQ